MPAPSAYRPPRWLPEGHSQTIWPALLFRRAPPAYRRECWPTPDGGIIALDFIDAPQPDAPLVVLFHGLEGSSHSHYAIALMQALRQCGWHGVVPHFRGCGGMDNPLPRAYHAGDSAEVAWILETLTGRYRTLYAAGVSLGGNMLLKHLGEAGDRAVVKAAAGISVPVDMVAASENLDRGLSRLIYTGMFLKTLKAASRATLARHPGLFDCDRMEASRTFGEFDDTVTAPLHGFAGARDYWTRASCKPWLRDIACPTLLLNARNDPFLPQQALPRQQEVSRQVTREFPDGGGHVGFISGPFPGNIDWLPARLLAFFAAHSRPDPH
ncbi:alpha/beta fold hydrolase [Laribacter hongkongensis]|uniref:Alpha/beta fold hydrolase n=1 Tax=Laribacter hongkongensis TaxID=168471 RepID=A0ABD4SMS7_9NEIS|nr:alpha/beta fold hydrolase [Laribacter hongkongensis]MCG9024423.1 alpha/beta fold hydrolase [Laribacter hongkongensis]MCG9099221.1 alpha/beta fold hydrolase [Laribacter hongkongensis]MCG9103080.1 alpha/beta fold hydrolase [Laribacter hongkongensis]MCG9111468.1 alpha/beta fold hydrolase [Laribacter hongkongensis]MCG9117313.1 alpha/beta fold hydrolase [Laribacter hongkongensis]